MDRPAAAREADPTIYITRSPFRSKTPSENGRPRRREGGLEELDEPVKRVKLRDLESVLRSEEGIKCSNSISPKEKAIVELDGSSQEEETSQITKVTAGFLSDEAVHMPMDNRSLEADAVVLSLGHATNLQSSKVNAQGLEAENIKESNKSCLPTECELEVDFIATDLHGLSVDLNNPFHPYKKLGQVSSTGASECGSTSGPIDKNDSMRRWKEMKQNGFLSSFPEIAPIPKPRGRHSKKKKDEEIKKNFDTLKREQLNRYTKVAAPCGLLSGLNPGIIKHVRNSKQVNSIIEAMLQSENLENQEQYQPIDEFRSGTKEVIRGAKEHRHASAADHLDLSLSKVFDPACFGYREQINESDLSVSDHKFNYDSSNASHFNSENDDDDLTLKLSSSVMASEHASSAANVDFSIHQESTTSLSYKAAGVASQWLELIQLDIKGRLAALRRSKKRVKNAIQLELPYLLFKDVAPDQENESLYAHSFLTGCPRKATLDMHMARWKTLFSKMEKSLLEEGKQLERWLRQVEELQSQCEKGLKYVGDNGFSQLDSAECAGASKSREAWEKECAVRAAAASIYSTSNMIMTADNLPCF